MSNTRNISPTVQYLGNGIAKEFAYLRASWEESDIYVYLGDTLQTSGYSISSEDLEQGATIIFDEAPANGVLITITRILELKRCSYFEESGVFKAEVLNEELNRLVAIIQQINDTANRGLLMPITVASANTSLPSPNVGKALVWNENGNGLRNSSTNFDNIVADATVLANAAAANASHALGSKNAAAAAAIKAEESKNEAAQIANAFDANAEEKISQYNDNHIEKLNTVVMNANRAEESARIAAESAGAANVSLWSPQEQDHLLTGDEACGWLLAGQKTGLEMASLIR